MQWLKNKIIPGVAVCILSAFPTTQAVAADHKLAIEDTYNRWVEATNAKDIVLWSTFLAPEATFLSPNNSSLLTRVDIEAFYSELFEDPLFHLDCEQDDLVVASAEDMAWSTGHCTATFTGSDGKTAQDKSKWAKVWL